MNKWQPLTGKLDRETIAQHKAIAVRGYNGLTRLLEDSESIEYLVKHNMSSIYKEYKLL